MTDEQKYALGEIIKHHKWQVVMALQTVKETVELADAIFRFQDKKADLDDVVDELADVLIMCNQLMIIHQCRDAVEQRIDYKIERQLKRQEMKNNG